jgi:predicted transcriptional regulator
VVTGFETSLGSVFHLVGHCEAAGAVLAWDEAASQLSLRNAAVLPEERLEALKGATGKDMPEEARAGLESRRALRLVLLARGDAARSALFCPVASLEARALGVPCTLHCERLGKRFVITTSRVGYGEAQSRGVPAFVLREAIAATLAAELGRAGPANLDAWLSAKSRGEWVLTPELAGALDVRGTPRDAVPTWRLGQLLDALGAALVDAQVHEAPAAQHQGATG